MRHRKITVVLAAIATLGLAGAADAQGRDARRPGVEHREARRGFAQQVDRRQTTQRARIREGRESGELNRREPGRLRQDQRQPRRMENRFAADGRHSPRERRVLDRNLGRSSRNLAHAKHDDRGRFGGRPDFGKRGGRSDFGHGRSRSDFGHGCADDPHRGGGSGYAHHGRDGGRGHGLQRDSRASRHERRPRR